MTHKDRFLKLARKSFKVVVAIVLLAAVYYVGVLTGRPAGNAVSTTQQMSEHAGHDGPAEPTLWTCSMHPQIQLPEPGQCPICGMDLVPLSTGYDDSAPRRLVMSPADQKLAEIETAPVERKFVDAKIRMVGTIDYDETRVRTISSYIPGRIDRLFVNYTGIEVKKGDHLAEIYSPALLTAQEELLEAKRRVANPSGESSTFLQQSDQRALESAREKLRLFGFSESQISTIENRGTPEDQMLITAPLGGIVVHKALNEGDYVQTGTNVYTVADLSKVWVKLNAYESDLPWIHFGQHVDIQAEAYPGEHFDGIIAFIDPVLDPRTRTVNVRVNVENPEGRLKPGMFVHGTVHSRVAKGGKIMDPSLAGKWISPMHPEIVRDKPGPCPVCGMPLLKAEDLGYVQANNEDAKPLVVPASAVMKTGRRAIVYVALIGSDRPTYEGREIVLGPRAGNYYIVESGLAENERVVTHGNFNIDSALQIQARPSMLSTEGQSPEEGGDIPLLRESLLPVYEAYLNTETHLARDDFEQAKAAFQPMTRRVEAVDMTLLEGDTHEFWMRMSRMLTSAAQSFAKAPDVDTARKAFDVASAAMIGLEQRFGHVGNDTYIEIRCPMAFGDGASWLQRDGAVANPYFGKEMTTCGNIVNEYAPESSPAPGTAVGHQH